jgi:predicted anti-sigma-YlaC factor YlaD
MIGRFRSAWRHLNLPCSEVARLASESLDRDLPLPSRIALRSHLIYCSACRRYLRQARRMREAMRSLAGGDPEEGTGLPAEVRERIKRALDEG